MPAVLTRCLACAFLGAVMVQSATSLAHAVDSRVDRRAAEMPLPDDYLDPGWPEAETEGLSDRYEPGDSDSVEEVPLEDDTELQAEQRALEALTGETPPAPTDGAAPATPPSSDGAAPSPTAPAPIVDDDAEILPGDDHRDPVEW